MKYIIWLNILFQILIFNIFGDNILSKFHQNSFKIKDFRLELVYYNEKYLNSMEIITFKYNRTTAAVNGSLTFKISVADKVEVLVQAYKFMSNEYRYFPMRFQINLKLGFDSNVAGLRRMNNCGNMAGFFFEKDVTYNFCNFVIDETKFPPLIPNGRFKMDLTFFYFDERIGQVFLFMEIFIPIAYPKNPNLKNKINSSIVTNG